MNNKKTVFVHIPRTGGNSVANAFGHISNFKVFHHDLRSPDFQFYSNKSNHSNNVFTIVRNPVSRLVSSYNYLRNGGNHKPDAFDAYLLGLRNMDLEEFIESKLQEAASWQIHFIPQTNWINEIDKIDVLRYEKLEEEVLAYSKKMNFDIKKLKKLNCSAFDTDTVLPSKLMRKIKKVYNADYKRFRF